MNISSIAGFILVLVSAAMLTGFALLRRKKPAQFRAIPAFDRLRKAIGLSVEEGSRLHLSLGRGGLTSAQGAAALAGLSLLRRLAELTSAGDRPPVATAGDAPTAILAGDVLQSAHREAASGARFDPTGGRLTGLTPFSYAAGTLPLMRDEQVSANILVGNFGLEAGLLADASERQNAFTLAASDNLSAQTILYANAQETLIGEELYASGAYVDAGPLHSASLTVQDILRWLLVFLILGGAILKLVGLL